METNVGDFFPAADATCPKHIRVLGKPSSEVLKPIDSNIMESKVVDSSSSADAICSETAGSINKDRSNCPNDHRLTMLVGNTPSAEASLKPMEPSHGTIIIQVGDDSSSTACCTYPNSYGSNIATIINPSLQLAPITENDDDGGYHQV
jgi:hypothetical protein